MEATAQMTNQPRLMDAYRWVIVAAGAVALILSTVWLPAPKFDWRFLILAAVMMVVSSRFSVQIPRVNTNITISDTFIFLVLLLYGGLAGILVAAVEGLFSGLRISKRPLVIAFNSAMMLASTSLTVAAVYFFFGPVVNLRLQPTSVFAGAMGTMALVQYLSNTGLSAICLACKTREPIWRTWHKHYFGTSFTYLMGAVIAAFTSSSIDRIGLTILFVGAPIIGIVYFTYSKYLHEIKSTAMQAEKAEHARAEAERARTEAESEHTEQAEHHVEELNRHIADQERIGRQLQESKDHFRHAAFHDALTNLPNRALLAESLKFVIERAK